MQMFNKYFLINKLANLLALKEFQVFLSQGCFDIVAKKKFLMLIKTLINVDGLNENQALSLRSISYFLSAYPLVVSIKTNREFLSNEMIYSRFELPVITPKMFENIIKEETVPAIESAKGRHTVIINAEILKKRRKELELTLQELSEIIGMSKKALYEIENKRVNPTLETVKNLESLLDIDLKNSYKLKTSQATYMKPKDEFQDKVSHEFLRMGIDNSSVYSAPFEIIGREKFSLITNLSKNTVKIKRQAIIMKRLSSFFSSKAVFVAKRTEEKNIKGIPVILESKLPEIESSKELKEIIERKTL